MIPQIHTNKGLLKTVIIFIFVLILLAYLGLNLRAIVGSEIFQDNWSFIKDTASNIWNNYLSGAVGFIWNNIFVPLIRKI